MSEHQYFVEYHDGYRVGPFLLKWFAEGVLGQTNLDPKSEYYGKGGKVIAVLMP